jgi:hypothetical protein
MSPKVKSSGRPVPDYVVALARVSWQGVARVTVGVIRFNLGLYS